MTAKREALIVATGTYIDAEIRRLRAPARDAVELASVLSDPRVGGFNVERIMDQPAHIVTRAIQRFFADRGREDLLLLAVSCHGIKDDEGRLFFAATDTERQLLDSTAVPAAYLKTQMDRCRARSIVLLLDCCYSGAFMNGSKGDTGVHLKEALEGHGRAIITASNAIEYAWEGDQLSGTSVPSVFTTAVVEGLRDGAADRDGDGYVSVTDLYDHVYERMRAARGRQTPQFWALGLEHNVYVALNPNPTPQASALGLPAEIRAAIDSPLASVRSAVVWDLARLARGQAGDLALAARTALQALADDDSRQVCAAAAEALAANELGSGGHPPTVTRSADGRWWWDGQQWKPVTDSSAVALTPPAAPATSATVGPSTSLPPSVAQTQPAKRSPSSEADWERIREQLIAITEEQLGSNRKRKAVDCLRTAPATRAGLDKAIDEIANLSILFVDSSRLMALASELRTAAGLPLAHHPGPAPVQHPVPAPEQPSAGPEIDWERVRDRLVTTSDERLGNRSRKVIECLRAAPATRAGIEKAISDIPTMQILFVDADRLEALAAELRAAAGLPSVQRATSTQTSSANAPQPLPGSLGPWLTALQTERATGTLTLTGAGGRRFTLYFLFGHLFHAVGPGSAGDQAVLDALHEPGDIQMDRKSKLPADETVRSSIPELLKR